MIESEPIKNESDITKKIEQPEKDLETALEKLERPANGDFVAGLRNFINWVKNLVAKDD